MADLLHIGIRPTDWNDESVPGALAYFYEAGTTNEIAVWQDAAGTIPHASPIEADGYGAFPDIYAVEDADVDVQTVDGESLPGYPRRAVRASAPASSAAGVSFAPTEEIPETDVQEAIEKVEENRRGMGSAGLIVKKSDGSFVGRTLTGTANQITVTHGGGDDSNPTIAAVIASQAEAEAGTNTTKLMTPQRTKQAMRASGNAPMFACRAWVTFNGATGAILASGNVASVTRHGTGDYTITFTTAMPDANYAVVCTPVRNRTDRANWVYHAQVNDPAQILAGSVRISGGYVSGTADGSYNAASDFPAVSVAIFR